MISASNNLGALFGVSAMKRHNVDLNKSLERLATGRRINRASDDPAGMVASENLKVELKVIEKKIEAAEFEQTRLGALDGAQGVMSDLLAELNGLVVRAANRDGYSAAEREGMQEELESILETMDYLSLTTRFGGQEVARHMHSDALGLKELKRGGKLNLIDGDLEEAQKKVEKTVEDMALSRAATGNRIKSLDTEINVLQEQFINLSDAHSQIVDTDYASETAKMVRTQMLRDAAQFATSLSMKQHADVVLALLG